MREKNFQTDKIVVDKNRIIVALDVPNTEGAIRLLDQLDSSRCRVKVGKELFTACGPELVRQIINRGFDVFLDLKFHDIPNTVAAAVKVSADLGVWMVNVHASGGRAMLEAASEALAKSAGKPPLLIGVTVLTSLSESDLAEVGIHSTPDEQVKRLAWLSADCGLDGVVCSASESAGLRLQHPDNFCLVTPGIRRAEDSAGDQKRVVGPSEAILNGSTYLVVGRPITRAESPRASLEEFYTVISGVL